jgi:AcrR family transcriptional regulator
MTIKPSKTQNRRAELLKVARQVFAEKGFETTTVSEIVSRAGVAQGTFYLYFPSKISVVKTLADELQNKIEQALHVSYAEAATVVEMIDRSVEAAFRIMGEYRDVLALTRTSGRSPNAEEANSRIFAPYHALIAEVIHRAQSAGEINATINPEVTAIFIVGTIYYAAEQCYVYHSSISPEIYITEAARFIRQALGLS